MATVVPTAILVNLAATLLLPLVAAFFYVFVWPGFEGPRGVLLLIAVPVALVLSAAALWWQLRIFDGVIISGQPEPGGESWSSFEAKLHARFWIGLLCAFFAEALVCHALAFFLRPL
jgi:hypothetical protein